MEVPFLWFARVCRDDPFDLPVTGLARLTRAGWRALSATQTGLLRSYVLVIGGGVAIGLLLVVALR